MNKFQIKKEKLPPLILEDILDYGWEEIEKTNAKRHIFQKDNYYLICDFSDPEMATLRIFARDPTLITWMTYPEHFRIISRCPSKEHFKTITNPL